MISTSSDPYLRFGRLGFMRDAFNLIVIETQNLQMMKMNKSTERCQIVVFQIDAER